MASSIRTTVLGGLLCGALCANAWAAGYFVATTGSDTNPGTLEAPFLTIQRAVTNLAAGDTCYIRGGVYRETVKPSQSGTAEFPITICAYSNETVTVSAADVVSGWTVHSGSIYKATMGWDLGDGFNQVWVDGAMMLQARYPNQAGPDLLHPTMTPMTATTGPTRVTCAELNQPNDFWSGGMLVGGFKERWSFQCGRITSSVPGVVYLSQASSQWFVGAGEGYVCGVLGALDTANEWHLQSGQLYLWAPDGGEPAGHLVEAKRRDWTMDFDGKSYVTVRGLNLFGGSVRMTGDHCILEYCTARYVSHFTHYDWSGFLAQGGMNNGHNGIGVSGRDNEIRYCEIAYSASSGIWLQGNGNAVTRSSIHDVCYSAMFGSAIHLSGSDERVWFNSMYNAGSAILFIAFPDGSPNTDIRYNDMGYGGLLTYDIGIIYTFGTAGNGLRLAYNWIHDCSGGDKRKGVYLDAYNRDYLVDHNVIWNCPGWPGVRINGPSQGNRIFNNTLFNCDDVGSHAWSSYPAYNPDPLFWTNNVYQYFDSNNLHLGAGPGPQLQDAANFDFRLTPGSSAIDTGVILPGFTDGYTGAAPDKGAYESGAGYWIPGANGVPAGSPEPLSPMVSNGNGASGMDSDSAVLNGLVLPTGTNATEVWCFWGAADGGCDTGAWAHAVWFGTVTGNTIAAYGTNAAGLSAGAVYHYRFYASNSVAGVWASASAEFTPFYEGILTNGLAGYWTLDETNGTTARDSTTNGNNAQLVGAPLRINAYRNRGLGFDGVGADDYVTIPNSATLEDVQEGNYTLSAWVRPLSTPPGTNAYDNNKNYGILIKTGTSGGRHMGLRFTQENRFEFVHYFTNDTAKILTSGVVTAGQWRHVAGMVDRAAGTIKLYIDGVLETADTFPSNAVAREYGTQTFKLGIAWPTASIWRWAAHAAIDDVRIYSRVLTQGEIEAIRGALNQPPSVILASPTNGTPDLTAPTSLELSAIATDDVAVVRVEFYRDAVKIGEATNAPYSVLWTNVMPGMYSLTARATDNQDATTISAPVAITVNAEVNQPPGVRIVSPTNDSILAGPMDITILAEATDDVHVASVEFYRDGLKLGETTSAPHSFVWTNVGINGYTLTAKATDNQGATALSAPVNISVTPTFPENTWTNLGGGMDNTVYALACDTNNNLYAGGLFTKAGDVDASRIAKWDGTSWTNLGSGVDGDVYAFAFDTNGNLYAAGYFYTAGGVAADCVAKWDGTNWTNLGSGMDGMGSANALAFGTNGHLYVGGFSPMAGGVDAAYIAEWDGTSWTNLSSGLSDAVYCLTADAAGNLYAGGPFLRSREGTATNRIAKWDGTSWTNLGTGMNGDAVYALTFDTNGNLYAGGYFTTANGSPALNIARWNGTTWTNLGAGMNSYVFSLARDAGGDICVGGAFNSAGGVAANRIARWDGAAWKNIGSGMDAAVWALTSSSDGNLYAGGDFAAAGGVSANRIARRAREAANEPTSIAITAPAHFFHINSRDVSVRGTASDASGVRIVKVNGRAVATTNGYANWTGLVNGLIEGTNAITAVAWDVWGNSATAQVSVIYSRPAGAVAIWR